MSIRIGFVGTGGIAGMHLNILPNIDGAELVAFSDLILERAQAVAERHGGRAYDDYHVMLDKEELDAVYVCLPPFAHGDAEISVIDKGINLFVEKPQALDNITAQDIANRIEDRGVTTAGGYNWRYLDITERAKNLLVGVQPSLGLGYWIGNTPGAPWWRKKSESGGQIVEQTTHVYDCARYLMGEVVSVYASGAKTGLMHDIPDYDVEDASTASLTFESGAVATILSSCVAEQGYGTGLHIISRGMTIKIEGNKLAVEREGETVRYTGKNNPYQTENETFIKAIKTGDPSIVKSNYSDGIKSLAVTLAANQSIETGKVVELT